MFLRWVWTPEPQGGAETGRGRRWGQLQNEWGGTPSQVAYGWGGGGLKCSEMGQGDKKVQPHFYLLPTLECR